MLDVGNIPGEQVVHTNDLEPFPDKPVAKVGSQKTRSAGNENSAHRTLILTCLTVGRFDDKKMQRDKDNRKLKICRSCALN